MKNDLVRKNIIRMFRRISVLRAVPLEKLQKLSDLLTEVSFNFLHYIYKKDDLIDSFYFILRGECEVTSSPGFGESGEELLVKRIMEREFFGERILLDAGDNHSRFNVLVSSQNAKLLKLTKIQFESVLGPMSELIDSYKIRIAKATAATKQPTNFNSYNECSNYPSKFSNIKLNSVVTYDIIGTLILGTFGSMTPNCSIRTYLLTDVDEQCCSNTVLNCIDACKMISFSDLDCPSLPKMLCLYRQLNGLHLLFNKPIVCDLKTMITHLVSDMSTNTNSGVVQHHKQKLNMDVIQYIMGCIVNGLDALHNMGIIYRNVNTNGLYIDAIGRVLFIDFCSSKITPKDKKTYTLCGIPDYLAPEQIAQCGHNKGVDLWSSGVLLYELCTGGSNPFHCSSEIQTYEKISSLGTKSFPKVTIDTASSSKTINSNSKSHVNNLIQSLIKPNPNDRLGMNTTNNTNNNAMQNLKKHEFFNGLNWDTLGTTQDSPFILKAISEQAELLKSSLEIMELDGECDGSVNNTNTTNNNASNNNTTNNGGSSGSSDGSNGNGNGINTIPSEVTDNWNVSYVGFGWDSEIDISSNV